MTSTHVRGLLLALTVASLAVTPAMAGSTGAKATETKATPEAMEEFHQADRDRDGYLSGKEGLDYVGTSLSLDDLAFRAADINSDGRLSPEEFASYVEASRARTMPATPADKPAPYSY